MLDGAVGTSLWERTNDRGPVWKYNIEKPQLVIDQAKEFQNIGSEIILTNTFGANRDAVSRTEYNVEEVVRMGVKLTREALADTDAKIALAVGPLSSILKPWGDLSETEAQNIYEEQIGAGMSEHPDIIYLMTFMDVDMMRIAVNVAKQYNVPIFCSMTFTKFGKTMMGNSVEDIVNALEPMGIDAIGMNCSLGPDISIPVIKKFAKITQLPLLFKPNAGTPILSSDGKEERPCTPKEFAANFVPAFEYVSYVGGCCGTNAEYLTAVKKELKNR